jgi:hypothetical protein
MSNVGAASFALAESVSGAGFIDFEQRQDLRHQPGRRSELRSAGGTQSNRSSSGFAITLLRMLNDAEQPPMADELVELRQCAGATIRLWRKRGLYATSAFLLSCASVYPFLEGHALHNHWNSIGSLVLLSMGLLLVFVLCNAFWYNAWQALRDVEKGRR